VSTVLGDLLKHALRRGGITQLPGTTPSTDQYAELIPEVNWMIASWNLDGHKIYTTSIAQYPMVANKRTYTIGPTGDFVAPRPISIIQANVVVLGTTPYLHIPMRLLSDVEFANTALAPQSATVGGIPASWPWALYNDGGFPNSTLYTYGYPTQVNNIELYTWDALKTDFTSITDAAVFPPGYEAAIIANLALKVNVLYPHDSKLTGAQCEMLVREARQTLEAVTVLNTECPNIAINGGDLSLRSAFYKWGANV
jgi:hypothetical protein